jgi:hypothetical protein
LVPTHWRQERRRRDIARPDLSVVGINSRSINSRLHQFSPRTPRRPEISPCLSCFACHVPLQAIDPTSDLARNIKSACPEILLEPRFGAGIVRPRVTMRSSRARVVASAKEYRADECIDWARTAQTDREREIFLQMARIWTDAAHRYEGDRASRPYQNTPLAE